MRAHVHAAPVFVAFPTHTVLCGVVVADVVVGVVVVGVVLVDGDVVGSVVVVVKKYGCEVRVVVGAVCPRTTHFRKNVLCNPWTAPPMLSHTGVEMQP